MAGLGSTRTGVLHRPLIVLLGIALLITARADSAFAFPAAPVHPDSRAPSGARADWLPNEEWVQERWMPFDEAQLSRILQLDDREIIGYLWNSGRTLNQLARRQGVPLKRLSGRLVSASWPRAKPAQRRLLRRRTARVLSQGHLADHMLRHQFHAWSVWRNTTAVFGMPYERYSRLLRRTGQTHADIAAREGISATELGRRALRFADKGGSRGVKLGVMTAKENARLRQRDRELLQGWLDYRAPPKPTASVAAHTFYCHLR